MLPLSPQQPVPSHWRGPWDTGGGLEKSELGSEVTAEVRRWLVGETSGPQCSQVVLDRALTVLSNFKLASGCQLEVLGGPLGAIVGGYSDADWLAEEVFSKQPAEAISDAFALFGFRARADGDWSGFVAEEVSLSYRRMCLRGHPSRGGVPRAYLKLQVAMEIIRAFAGEAGPLELADITPESGFVLSDVTLARELQLSSREAEEEAKTLSQEQLEEMNRALDEYILRQMCFKSEIVDEIARLHEDSAYAILGVSSSATDAEIKRAYRLVAMQCHPDKGGDKEDFQELNNAYEKIMEQRRSLHDDRPMRRGSDGASEAGSEGPGGGAGAGGATRAPGEEPTEQGQGGTGKGKDAEDEPGGEDKAGEEGPSEADAEHGERGSASQLLEKATKAAEEASRYAKTAAEFAHQAADAAETARQGREQGSHNTLTKSIAHSAIVLTLTVVKAVRVVGYATLDVAAQCRAAAKRNPEATECAEKSVSAMSLGLEALNAALACAEVTETTAAELQAPLDAEGEEDADSDADSRAADRFVSAAVRASLAAASASNAAMSAAIAAVEGSRQCAQALGPKAAGGGEQGERRRGAAGGEEGGPEAGEAGAEAQGADEAEAGRDNVEPQCRKPTPEELAANAVKRLVAQRHNNHKVLQRLNAEILGHQRNVRDFLQANRQLIPEVSGESKQRVTGLLQAYAREAGKELVSVLRLCAERSGSRIEASPAEEVLSALRSLPMLVPFLQPQNVAIPVSVKARVLMMAALYDFHHAIGVVEEEVFSLARGALSEADVPARASVDEIRDVVHRELCRNVAEEASEAAGGVAPACGQGGAASATASAFGSEAPAPAAAAPQQGAPCGGQATSAGFGC